MIRSGMERLISCLPGGKQVFFDPGSFSWVHDVESEWRVIRQELDRLLCGKENIPNFQDISPDQALLTEGAQWKTYFFYAYGHRMEQNCARCPETTRLLNCINGMKTAMFSILAPKKHIPEHRGPYSGVLRYHLGLIVPQPFDACRLRVANQIRSWEEGKSLIFDDSHLHEVWNDSDQHRVVLFVDFIRPLPPVVAILNRAVINRISKTPLVNIAVENARRLGHDFDSAGPSPFA